MLVVCWLCVGYALVVCWLCDEESLDRETEEGEERVEVRCM